MEQKLTSLISDTICAPATPAGSGGISVIRISGADAIGFTQKIWVGKRLDETDANRCVVGYIKDTEGDSLDQCVATVFRSPHSFTGEDIVEISVHGSPWIVAKAMQSLVNAGCRIAEKGEFTKRAFFNGRMDLSQAESVADMIATNSKAAQKMALRQLNGNYSSQINNLRDRLIDFASLLELELDFSEEDVEFADRSKLLMLAEQCKNTISRLADSYRAGRVFKEGIPVTIAGRPNAGKSTLLNALVNEEKAIVTDIPGTTRDVIEATAEIGEMLFRFHDTAGLHATDDPVERIGIKRTESLLASTDMVIWLIDVSAENSDVTNQLNTLYNYLEEISHKADNIPEIIIALNKTDAINSDVSIEELENEIQERFHTLTGAKREAHIIAISARHAPDLEQLKDALRKKTDFFANKAEDAIVTNARHYQLLIRARHSITRAISGINEGVSADFIAQDVRETLHHLGAITGSITTPDLLHTIFSRFCIGK